ncbi:helix-turn-helix transcriptional regulator [Actinoplanes sp. CA-054009]
MDDHPLLMGAAEIERRLGVSESWAKNIMGRAGFPTPIERLGGGRVWWAWQIERYIRDHRPHQDQDPDMEKAPPPAPTGREAALAEIIQARIELALIHQERASIEVPGARRGLAGGGPDHLTVRLTIADVARIAAQVLEDAARQQMDNQPGQEGEQQEPA